MYEVERGKILAVKLIFKLLTATGLLVLFIFFPGSLSLLGATERLPRFTDYPASPVYPGKTHALLPRYRDAHPKTGLPDAVERKADFAGHYILIHAGCGVGCSYVSVMDARTWKIYPLETRCSLMIGMPFTTKSRAGF